MDLCARPGPHQAPICPCRRTLSAFFVLPQVLLSLHRYDIGPFRSPAGPAVPAPVRYRPFPFSRRSCCPCADTLSALFVLSQVLAGRGRRASGRQGALSHVGRGRRLRPAPRRLTQSFYERVTPGFERCSRRPFRSRNVLQTHAVVPPSSPFSAGALPGSARLVLRARRFPRLRFFSALLSLARIPSALNARGSAP